MNVSPLPRCSSPSLVFWPAGHINYPLMNDTENSISTYYSHRTLSAIHPAAVASGSHDLLQKALLIAAGLIIKALLQVFAVMLCSLPVQSGGLKGYQRPIIQI